MKQSPRPRQQIYDLYWYFAAERQAILDRRVAGAARPWTHDLILQTFKFCNVYRAVDRVSKYMIREVACSAEPVEPVDRLFQIVAFRTFSKIETWRGVRAFLGRYPTLEDLGSGSFTAALEHVKKVNDGLYTGAFIFCANNAYGHTAKHLNPHALLPHFFLTHALGYTLLDTKSLHKPYE